MFDIKKILTRSWKILWSYRLLWVFGFLMALAGVGSQPSDNLRYTLTDTDQQREPAGFHRPADWENIEGLTPRQALEFAWREMGEGLAELQAMYPVEFRMGVAALITLVVVVLLVSLLTAVLYYVAETATIHLVDAYEQSGVKVGLRQGWRYGWNRSAWRVFVVNFIVHLPVLGLCVALALIGWWIFTAFMDGARWSIISSLIGGTGLAFLLIFATVLIMVVLFVVRDFAWRLIVLEGAAALESLGQGWALVRRQWKNIGLTWLVMFGLKIVWGVSLFILVFPLLAVSIFTSLGGVLAALVPSLITAGIAGLLSAPEYWPWVFGGIVGLPIFFVVAFSPLFLVAGWGNIYQSNVWTLAYRELKALETVRPVEELPAA
jgi:hypothetical protein